VIAKAISITRTISSALKFATATTTATTTRKTTSSAIRGTASDTPPRPNDGVVDTG